MSSMTKKAESLLVNISLLPEASKEVNKRQRRAAGELVMRGYAIVIPKSSGGGELALTPAGIEVADVIVAKTGGGK